MTTLAKMLTGGFKKINHIITASASYHGDLIKDNYQFTWSGQSVNSYKKHDVFNGFLVPSNGRIKKFIVLDTGLKFNITHNKTIIDYITSEVGFNNSFPLFSLVLIKENENPLVIGTLSLYFDYKKK